MNYKSIAIDGPSGAGKSTLAKKLAEELGFLYVDTGAIYRTVGLYAFRNNISSTDAAGVTALLKNIKIDLRHGGDGLQHMFLGGTDVTDEIRRHEISKYASDVSAVPAVRAFLLDMQRSLARTHNVIMDGRDIATVVLPQADVKLFLTASPEVRAERRYLELKEKGNTADYETVLSDLKQRDFNDSTRTEAPLRQAEDAILVDTTDYTLKESFRVMLDLIRERLAT
ncbi:Cytidylate kinase [bioreactor metagenome]|uniref:(d)CMP kinase n=1 Tax=bioreactor metagenome TaxID=1076179 RepID=A0A644XEB1_9ZZZZ